MGERQLELALVELLNARFFDLGPLQRHRLLPVALHRVAAVEGRARYRSPRCAVDQKAGAAETLEVLQIGQHGRLVVFDVLIHPGGIALYPGHPRACTLTRAMVAVQGRDLPLLDRGGASEDLRRPVAARLDPPGARVDRLVAFPPARGDASAGLPVDQQ